MESIRQLLLKKLREDLSAPEQARLDSWLAQDAANSHLLARLEDEEDMKGLLKKMEGMDEETAWEKIQQQKKTVAAITPLPITYNRLKRRVSQHYLWRVAAVLLLLIGGVDAWLIWQSKKQHPPVAVNQPRKKPVDIPPGGDRAVLTLADGTQITLDSASDGSLASQGNIKVIKLDNGQLAYKGDATNASGEILYNTITTPRGGQYQLVMADGTKVWLNAASSFRYPVTFIGSSRQVELTGEGYFEVVKNTAQPFIVHIGGTQVTVLGTHFNIMAYANEPARKVTLLEGSVQVSKGPQMVVIKPGEQATVQSGIRVASVDTEEAVAWKNGNFEFRDTDIHDILRQLERWYDVDVITKNYTHPPRFYGIISRSATLSKVLNMLEVTGEVQFRLEGKKLILE